MLMKNFEIYEAARVLAENFTDSTQYLPVKINFFILKNRETLITLAQDIEMNRMNIIRNYGISSEENENQFIIAPENIEAASKELDDLFSLEQEVNIYKININSIPEDISLTTGQMSAILFMID